MVKKLTMILAGLFLSVGMAMAQAQINGTVVSQEDGEPIIGASVLVVGTNVGVATDIDGKFTLALPAGHNKLRISYVGMLTQEVTARDGMVVNMQSDSQGLDEVIVVAYGTQKKASFTGSASTIKAEKIEKLQVSNLSKALEGAVAGVQSFSSSGTPGSGATILIRGIGSISSTQTPLIVVDGVPYEGSLNSISSQDIESFTILKDAAANSMYGARGANGVIMITTKTAKGGKARVNFDARWGFNARGVPNYETVRDPGTYYELFWESMRNNYQALGDVANPGLEASNKLIEELKYNIFRGVADTEIIDPVTGKLNPLATTRKWNDDWTKDPFENGFRQEYNANVSGGNENTHAYFSLGYLGDKGYIAGSDFKRYSTRLKIDQNIGNNIRVGANLAYSNTDQKTFGNTENNYSNIFMFSQNIAPIYPIYLYDDDGNPVYDDNGNRSFDFGDYRPYGSNQNPYAVAMWNQRSTLRDNLSARGYFEWTFLNDFKFTLNGAYDLFNTTGSEFYTPIGGDAKNVNGRAYKDSQRYAAINLNQLLDWTHDFGNHNVHVLLGHETKNDKSKYLYGHMTNFAHPEIGEFANATQYQDLTSYTSEYSLEGFFAKGEYNYLDRYYFTASIRRDGSSRFHKDNRWGTFWAVGASWRLKEEPWLKEVNWLNALKLKASYGTQGNDRIGIAHAYTDLFQVDRMDGDAAFTKYRRGNKDLTWEKSHNFNIGVEAGFWNRLNVNFEFFIKETKDMLYYSPIPRSEGSPSGIYRNEMDMKNTGFEIEINGDIIKTKHVRWNAALNLTHYKNKLTRLPVSKPAELYPDGYPAGNYWRKIGGSLYDWYMYEYVGVDAETGLPQYNKYLVDEEGNETGEIELVDNITDATQRQLNKSAIPDLTGGFSTTVEAYGFDLSIQTAFQLGGWAFDSSYNSLLNAGNAGYGFHKDVLKRWTPENTNTNIPMLRYQYNNAGISGNSDYYLTKASYFSLRNITLGYTLPKKVTNSWGINSLRIYLVGDNIWLASKRKGFDPRQSIDGDYGYFGYSALSSYSIGVNLSF